MTILDFDDYSHWLHAEIGKRIEKNRKFSVHAFAKKVGMGQSYLSLLLNKKRKLTMEKASALAEQLRLSPLETQYLKLLIQHERAGTEKLKNLYKREMGELKKMAYTHSQTDVPGRPYSAWHYGLLLAATDLTHKSITLQSLAADFDLEESKVEEAMKLMEQLKIITQYGQKCFAFNPEGLEKIPEHVAAHSTWKICNSILEKAKARFDHNHLFFDILEGGIVATSPERIDEAKKRIKAFMQELREFLREGERTVLVQYSLQLFEAGDHQSIKST